MSFAESYKADNKSSAIQILCIMFYIENLYIQNNLFLFSSDKYLHL